MRRCWRSSIGPTRPNDPARDRTMTTSTESRFVGDPSRLRPQIDIRERVQPEYHQKEIDRVFRRGWLLLAATVDLKENNSFIVREVAPLKTSLIVARGADGDLRAFHNTCRHRANRLLAPDAKGSAPGFACGFHGWTYATDGRLTAVPDRGSFTALDEANLGLIPVHAEEWEGLVFVNFAARPEMTLAEWLGVLHGQYRGHFAGKVRVATYRIQPATNWNVAINAFGEGYHAGFLHKKTVPNYQGGKTNPNRHRPYLEVTPHHGRYTAQGNPDREQPAVEALSYRLGRQLYPSYANYRSEGLTLPLGLNPAHIEQWLQDVLEVFPHVVMLIGAHWHALLWFWPIDAGHTDIRVEFFAYPAKTVGDHMAHAHFRARLREVFREDISTMEAITRQLQSGALQYINLSQQELLVQQHYAAVATMVDGAPGKARP
ncbi:MAG: aromatic ring-hydroxylating dioxygenase subunit alpha [Alphaproteobacteria bacterium]|nr:aromatic ring-hydroxylating dioxygenase subunit alpha [Alphaproteobacteria bacterium]